MGQNSILGTEPAPQRPEGSSEDLLGPSDGTDSGSDTVGADSRPAADPSEPVDQILRRDIAYAPIENTSPDGEDAGVGDDISVDRIFGSDGTDGMDGTDDDAKPGPIEDAMAPDPMDNED